MSRGFTLIELMVVCAISSILAAAMGAMYLQARIDGARIEAGLGLAREASLVTEWLRRDLRGATAVTSSDDGLTLARPAGPPIQYRLRAGLLWRDDGEARPIAADVVRLVSSPVDGQVDGKIGGKVEHVELSLSRALGTRNTARLERSFIAVRLP